MATRSTKKVMKKGAKRKYTRRAGLPFATQLKPTPRKKAATKSTGIAFDSTVHAIELGIGKTLTPSQVVKVGAFLHTL